MKDFYTLADLRGWKEETPPIRLGVFGDPVAHSLSPRMQNAALQECGIEMQYAAFHILPNELSEALGLLRSRGFVGVNLTIPHKTSAAALVDELDPVARVIGAINTVRVEERNLLGYNTDGPGFARAIREEFSVELRDLRILLLGARGGAGRAIAQQSTQESCRQLTTLNRGWREDELRRALAAVDLVVNATPLALPEILSPSDFDPRLMIYDVNYTAAPPSTRAANGLSMLLHQGALAFEKWFEREAPIETMRAALLPFRDRAP